MIECAHRIQSCREEFHKAIAVSPGDARGMKTSLLLLPAVILPCLPLTARDAEPKVISSTVVSARDGFTRSNTGVLFTRHGVTQKVEREVVLETGLRVRPDGSATLPGGGKAMLKNNQLLTPRGAFEDVALTPQGTAPVTSGGPPMNSAGPNSNINSPARPQPK